MDNFNFNDALKIVIDTAKEIPVEKLAVVGLIVIGSLAILNKNEKQK
jgi:hypothetical protein